MTSDPRLLEPMFSRYPTVVLPPKTPKWVRDEFLQFPTLATYGELVKALDAETGVPAKTWATILKHEQMRPAKAGRPGGLIEEHSQLRPLAIFLRRGLSGFSGEARMASNERRKIAHRIHRLAKVLAEELIRFESKEQFVDWYFAVGGATWPLLGEISKLRRLQPVVSDSGGADWVQGFTAAIEHPNLLLEAISQAAITWQIPRRVASVARPSETNADRTFFIRTLSRGFQNRYGKKLLDETRAFTIVFFPDAGDLDVTAVSHRLKPTKRKANTTATDC